MSTSVRAQDLPDPGRGAPANTLIGITFDVYRLVQACVEALRTGHFAGFERVSNENVAEWNAASRKLLAWDDPSDEAVYPVAALDRILERMEAERAAVGVAR